MPQHVEFKRGDEVICINPGKGNNLELNKIYIVSNDINREELLTAKDKSDRTVCAFAFRFKKVNTRNETEEEQLKTLGVRYGYTQSKAL